MSFSESEGSGRAADLVLEGLPPGSGRPSWLGPVIGVVVALLVGLGVGYGIGTAPRVTPGPTLVVVSSQPTATPSATPLGLPFIADPCRLVPNPILSSSDYIASVEPSALAGMTDCAYLDPSGSVLAAISLRQAPSIAAELAVIVDEVFQREGVNEADVGGQHAFFIACAHAWTPCRPALALIREPYFLVISLGPGQGGFESLTALAAAILRSLPN